MPENIPTPGTNPLSRRRFLTTTAAGAAAPALLAGCSLSGTGGGSGDGSSSSLSFWDMAWADPSYTSAAEAVVAGYQAADGLPAASYQVIQWNNFYQTFSSAIASGSGPSVSSGAGFQAFQFAEQGAIAYADDLIEKLRADGTYDDFLPGTVESLRTDAGYVGVPWQVDVRVLWYNRTLLEQAGVPAPTDWASYLTAGLALQRIGVVGFANGAGAGNNMGAQTMLALMLNNGGGLFDEDGNPDCVIDANVEAMDFVRDLVAQGISDPAAVSYTADNLTDQWNTRRAGMGFFSGALKVQAPDVADELVVASPLTSPSGATGSLYFVNNLMMYQDSPSQEGSEAFLQYYLKSMSPYWSQQVLGGVPVLKSIAALPEWSGDPDNVRIVDEWQPISKTYAARGSQLFAGIAAVDGGQALTQFAQTMLQGSTDSTAALQTLQTGIEGVL